MTTRRRQFLRLCGIAGIGAVAGCSDGSDETPTTADTTADGRQPTEPSSGATRTPGDTTDAETPQGGPTDDETATPTGTSTGGSGTAKLAAADGDSGDFFGSAVAVSSDGTTALVGASSDEDPNGTRAGSAYVFEASGGSWTQAAKLAADDGTSEAGFGGAVALSGDGTTALVGTASDVLPNDDQSDAAYVFDASGGSWTQQTTLTADDGGSGGEGDGDGDGDGFGRAVALSDDGTTALVGASQDADPNGENAGSAYVFDAGGGSWTQGAKLAADDGDSGDFFGSAVAVSNDGTTALVGASSDEDPNGTRAGSAYVFEATDGSWTQAAKLTDDGGNERDYFGVTAALSNDGATALVGAYGGIVSNDETGSASVFAAADGSWVQRATLTAEDGESGDNFGWSVALSGDGATALVGAPRDDGSNGEGAGSASVFDAGGESWTQRETLTAPDGDGGDWFGRSVAVSDDGATAIAGALRDEDPNGEHAGSAYVFEL